MAKKIIYCTLWSVALFTATFYTLIGQDAAFVFDGKLLLEVASSHVFPMIMAMMLYLFDVMYAASLRKSNSDNLVIWVLGTVIVFMGGFVASILVNDNFLGWSFFGVAWLALTALKFVTTEDEQSTPYIISED